MPAAGFRSGKLGRASANGTNVKITRWKVDPKGEKLDFTNSESGGNGEYLGGIKDYDWEIDFYYYVTAVPFNLLVAGDLLTNLILFIGDPADTVSWTFPSAFVESGSCESRVRGKVEGTFRGCSSGSVTKPTS